MKINTQRYTFIKTIILLSFIILPFIGSDCNNTNTQNSGNISGTWRLNFIQGNLQDICLGETVLFPSNSGGTATLTCPNQTPVSHTYTVSNNELTYDTGARYTITTSNASLLVLTGTFGNGTRILSYEKVTTTSNNRGSSSPGKGSKNSSEQNF